MARPGLLPTATRLAESGLVPDRLVRAAIRTRLAARLREQGADDAERALAGTTAFVEGLPAAPLALAPERANEQHYEVPASFFEQVLGPRLKYSCALFEPGVTDLALAEERMLHLACQRAGLRDGMSVLDLGCGWGSMALYVAERFPGCRVTAVSNSKSQREFVLARAASRGLEVDVHTADVNHFEPERRFDRVVSIEMFEHVRNWPRLFARVAGWLEPRGRLFLHVFCHRDLAYPFEDRGDDDWMARHFFTGGMMPADRLPYLFPDALRVEGHWRVGGEHYRRTADAWLANLDARTRNVLPALREAYGDDARLWLHRWRLFFLACSELFGYRGGSEWWVSHYRLARASAAGEGPR